MNCYPDLYSKAAALTESLIGNHAFSDGNKRVGITAGTVFMKINGFTDDLTPDDVYEAAYEASVGNWRFTELLTWFKIHFFPE